MTPGPIRDAIGYLRETCTECNGTDLGSRPLMGGINPGGRWWGRYGGHSHPTSGGAGVGERVEGERQRPASGKATPPAGIGEPKMPRTPKTVPRRVHAHNSCPIGEQIDTSPQLDSWPHPNLPARVRASNAEGHGDGPHREAAGRRCAGQ
jgi:hypothetical protein